MFISLMSFSVIRLIPGDPVMHLIGERGASAERIAEMRTNLGLDQPIYTQFFIFTKNIFKGDFGESVISKQPVMSEFRILFPATVELSVVAIIWSSIIGLGLGILAGIKRNSFWDYASVSLSTIGFAMPLFWWGLICIFTFAVRLGWFPVSGRIDVIFDVTMITGSYLVDSLLSNNFEAFFSALRHLILPAFVLGTIPLALIVRVTRSSFIDIAKEDYIRTARAKGLSNFKVVSKHIMKNALPQILTVIGLSLGQLLTGAIMTETLFSWPGIGRWLIKSIEARDYAVVQAGLFYAMIMILVINILTDELIKKINPKLRDASR
jgi:dipeptide transport system permease protein